MEGQFFDKMGAAIKEKMSNVVLAAVCDGGRWRSFYTTDKQIKSAADMKGLKIRTINSPLQQEFVNKLGGSATPVSWGELYTALATGVVTAPRTRPRISSRTSSMRVSITAHSIAIHSCLVFIGSVMRGSIRCPKIFAQQCWTASSTVLECKPNSIRTRKTLPTRHS
jgi:hypothetical protein